MKSPPFVFIVAIFASFRLLAFAQDDTFIDNAPIDGAPIRVACLGDSITAGARVDAATQSYPARLQSMLGEAYDVRNFGLGSATLLKSGRPNVWRRLEEVQKFEPHVAVISLGTNDTVGGKRKNWEKIDAFDDDYGELIKSLASISTKPHIVVCTPTAMVLETPGLSESRLANLRERQPRLQDLCGRIRKLAVKHADNNVTLLELNAVLKGRPDLVSEADGVHPNAKGYEAVAQAVADHLQPKTSLPNVLFIAMDDLNDWIGCMGGHPQTLTPNLDRLAKSGVLFTNAHCPAPACNPSRTAILTGRSPHVSGLYENGQNMREVLPDAEIMPKTFSRHGYHASGSGKLLHYFIDSASWDDYYPEAKSENPFPRTLYPKTRPLTLPRGGPWQYIETDWGPLKATDEEYGGDYLVTRWVSEQLAIKRNQPFFLACGIYRPHEPWFVPQKYFEPFALDSIQLPVGFKPDDLDDLPPEGKRRGPNRYFAHIQKENQWKHGVQGYLASIHYADAMLGRVLNALDKSPHADNTIVVLWSDHGWHLGEKQHWQKYTGWRACTRVPLIIRIPTGVAGWKEGVTPASCDKPVSLLSLFPTLLDLCDLPPESHHDGPSLLPLLRDSHADWPHVAVTHLADPGSFSVSAEHWRYIHYRNGDEELYDIATDPYEWRNLAAVAEHAEKLKELRSRGPTEFAPKPAPKIGSLPALPWRSHRDGAAPPSQPDGAVFDVVFINDRKNTVKLHWMDRDGTPKFYADIAPAGMKTQRTRPGAVWLLTAEDGAPLGHFKIGDRSARAVVPAGS